MIRTHAGLVECSCPDYEARHRGVDGGCCKHGKAMVQLGLMAAPAIVELPRAEEAPAPSPSPSPSAEARRIARAQAAAFGIKVPAAAVEAPAVVAEQAPAIVEPSEAARVERAPAGFATELVAAVGPIEPPADAQVEAPAPCCPADEAEPCMPCRSAEVAAVQADPKPEPDGPGLFTLDEHIDAEADRLAGYGTDAGHLMARTLRELARTVRFVEARTPGDFADRAAALAAR